jgi:hypothetical protein
MTHNPEYNQQLIDEIKGLVTPLFPIHFEHPITVKKTPHHLLFICHSLVITKDNELKLMDGGGLWHETLPDQANAGYVLSSVLQRLKSPSVAIASFDNDLQAVIVKEG